MYLALLDLLHQRICISKSTDNSCMDSTSVVIKLYFFQSFFSTNSTEFDLIHFHTVMSFTKAPEYGFCHTTGYSEDHTCTRSDTKRHIGCFDLQIFKADTGFPDHCNQLCCSQYIINILSSIRGRFRS